MRTKEEKPIKIQLLIGRKHRERAKSPQRERGGRNWEEGRTARAKLHVTVMEKETKGRDTVKRIPLQTRKVDVSEFEVPDASTARPHLPTQGPESCGRADTLESEMGPITLRLPRKGIAEGEREGEDA